MWSTGICASPLVKRTTSIAKDSANSVFLTDDQLRVLAPSEGDVSAGAGVRNPPAEAGQNESEHTLTPIPNVYAIGDCAQMIGKALPATAQVASQKGKHLAMVLNGQMSDTNDDGERIFKHRNMGSMASLGSGSAIVDSPNAKAQGRVRRCLIHPKSRRTPTHLDAVLFHPPPHPLSPSLHTACLAHLAVCLYVHEPFMAQPPAR